MHYVKELIMIISDVQIAFFPLDSVLALIEKNFWHFSIDQQLLNLFHQLFSASILHTRKFCFINMFF